MKRGMSLAVALGATVAFLIAPGSASAGTISADLVKGGLAFPAAFTLAPDGRIFYGQRFTGQIRIIDPSSGNDALFFTVPNVVSNGEQGLLGLALRPQYPAKPYVYAYATRNVSGTLRNQIVRITDTGGTGSGMRVIFSSDTVAGDYHDGGHIAFGPDRMLYAVVGEGHSPSNAQNLNNNAGKVLRMTPRGKVPADNPIPGSKIFSYGLRNSFGFTFDPVTGILWETENGPSCNDEINPIQAGKNYGWGPHQTCNSPPPPPRNTNQDGPNPRLPKAFFTPTIAPTGTVFCTGCGLTGAEGAMFFGDWNNGDIHQVTLTAARRDIASMSVVYPHSSGILSVERGPDGTIYFSDPTAIYRLTQS
jgi:glucose/arabinose dehydrogenase